MPKPIKTKNYIETMGRRKESLARVRLFPADKKGTVRINGKDLTAYFPTAELQSIATTALHQEGVPAGFSATVVMKGGGIHSQAEALRHGLARAIVANQQELRQSLKKAKLLTRDARTKERRKFGLKKARKAPQWSKR